MRWLWLTLADPEPATNGQLLYSKGLIEAACQAGASLTVIGLARPERPRSAIDPDGIDWRLADERVKPAWQRLLSPDPKLAQRIAPEMERMLERALAERSWDAVVFDSICGGWGLRHALSHRARSRHPPRLIYLAHNHEVTVARRIAASAHGLRRFVTTVDWLKTSALERRLVRAADVVSANAPEDCQRFAAEAGGRPIMYLPPGYGGPRLGSRVIDAAVPRRAILVGSLDWPPKRLAVEAFLQAGAEALARAGVELQIVGEVDPAYIAGLRRRFPSVDFVGRVDNVRPYLQQARLALVPDLLGGFKLKGLDYVFHRLPILAMRPALPGMPLEDGSSVGLFDSHDALTRAVLALIDDFATLNQRHEAAWAACADVFDWNRIGRDLVAAISAASPARITAGSIDPTAGATSPPARLAAGK